MLQQLRTWLRGWYRGTMPLSLPTDPQVEHKACDFVVSSLFHARDCLLPCSSQPQKRQHFVHGLPFADLSVGNTFPMLRSTFSVLDALFSCLASTTHPSQLHLFWWRTAPLSSIFLTISPGAGKTYTMLGVDSEPGIYVRTLNDLFKAIEACKEDIDCSVYMSYLEVSLIRVIWSINRSINQCCRLLNVVLHHTV